MSLRDAIAGELATSRARMLDLLEPLDERDLTAQHSPLMSPLVWDLAHVGSYEDLWLVRGLGHDGVRPDLDDLYDAFRHPRRDRPSLPILDPTAARGYIAEVRTRALDALDEADLANGERLVRNGFVHGMVVQHEHQHIETMLATLQLADVALWSGRDRPHAALGATDEVKVDGGSHPIGTSSLVWAYDNERPAHTVEVAPFAIDTTPVTNERYEQFVADGGYDQPQWWTADGWAWRQSEGLVAPQHWSHDGTVRRFGATVARDPHEPVQHVCWYEADAFARWAGRRLPTEIEWEVAAAGATTDGADLAHGAPSYGPSPIGSSPTAPAASGALDMLGGVWEWTSSDFAPWPGFESFPYREYSEVFFGPEYKVLRGGSWATHPSAARTTFRNWDYPIRRQIFAGFRTARSL